MGPHFLLARREFEGSRPNGSAASATGLLWTSGPGSFLGLPTVSGLLSIESSNDFPIRSGIELITIPSQVEQEEEASAKPPLIGFGHAPVSERDYFRFE